MHAAAMRGVVEVIDMLLVGGAGMLIHAPWPEADDAHAFEEDAEDVPRHQAHDAFDGPHELGGVAAGKETPGCDRVGKAGAIGA